jgi:Flp pilus assembly protein CpaB
MTGNLEPDEGKRESFLARIKRNWLETLILIGVLVAVFFLLRGLPVEEERRSQVMVTAEEGVPAYRIITAAHIDVEDMEVAEGAFTDITEVEGRYALQWLEPGKPVTEAQVSKVQLIPEDFEVWQVIALPATQASTLGGALKPGDRVAMVLAPRPDANRTVKSEEFENVLILAVKALESAGNSEESTPSVLPVSSVVVAAILDQDMDRLKPLLATSDVYFVLHGR